MKKENKEIIAYKGFDKNLKCRDYQYEVGKTFEHKGKVEACESGFHACEYPLDVFRYYPPSSSRFAIVKMHGETSKDSDDTKIASAKITIETEIKLPEMINRAVDWIKNKINWSDDNTSNYKYWQSVSSYKYWRLVSSYKYWRLVSSYKYWQSVSSYKYWRLVSSYKYWQSVSSYKYWRLVSSYKYWRLVSS
ncbi:MAG: hypothetical protein E6Y63_07500 [Haemophilus parainfluenzae]|nr:hypothetical protein [Haemophilus parainfluenzae]